MCLPGYVNGTYGMQFDCINARRPPPPLLPTLHSFMVLSRARLECLERSDMGGNLACASKVCTEHVPVRPTTTAELLELFMTIVTFISAVQKTM